MKFARLIVLLLAVFAATFLANADEFTVISSKKKAPDGIAKSIAVLLDSSQVIELLDGGKPVCSIWFRKALPVTDKPLDGESNLKVIDPYTLLGVVQVHEKMKDFRNDEIEKGVYTARFQLLPVNGNHLNSSPFPYFAVLVPAKYDKGPKDISDDDTLDQRSRKGTVADHPSVLSLQPLDKKQDVDPFPALGTKRGEWKYISLQVPAKVESSNGETSIKFALVYEGHGKI